MKRNQSSLKLVTIVSAIVAIGLLVGAITLFYKHRAAQNLQSASTSMKVDGNNDAKFEGNVTATNFSNDNCTLTLNNTITVTYCFNTVQVNEQPHGHVIDFGTLILNKKASVYAHKIGQNTFTLAGSDKYFLKGIK